MRTIAKVIIWSYGRQKCRLNCGDVFLNLGASMCKHISYINVHRKIEERACTLDSERRNKTKK